jgi:hypothetical protein
MITSLFNLNKLSYSEQVARGEKSVVVNNANTQPFAETFALFIEANFLRHMLPSVYKNQAAKKLQN